MSGLALLAAFTTLFSTVLLAAALLASGSVRVSGTGDRAAVGAVGSGFTRVVFLDLLVPGFLFLLCEFGVGLRGRARYADRALLPRDVGGLHSCALADAHSDSIFTL